MFYQSDQSEPISHFSVTALIWDPLSTNVSGLNSNDNGVNSNVSRLNSSLVDENEEFGDDDGWDFKTAESEARSGTGSTKVKFLSFTLIGQKILVNNVTTN